MARRRTIIIPRDITKADKVFFDLTMGQFVMFTLTFFLVYFTIQTRIPGLIKWIIIIIEVIIGGAMTWGEVEKITFTQYIMIMFIYFTRPKKFAYSSDYKYKLLEKLLRKKLKK